MDCGGLSLTDLANFFESRHARLTAKLKRNSVEREFFRLVVKLLMAVVALHGYAPVAKIWFCLREDLDGGFLFNHFKDDFVALFQNAAVGTFRQFRGV